jgi:ribosomal protein S27E
MTDEQYAEYLNRGYVEQKCPHCGDNALTYPASAFSGNFRCHHCGAFNSGDVGCSPPGYWMLEDGEYVHYVTQKQLDDAHHLHEILYGKPKIIQVKLPKQVILPNK